MRLLKEKIINVTFCEKIINITFCEKIINITFCEKITNLASQIKRTHHGLPSKEDNSLVN